MTLLAGVTALPASSEAQTADAQLLSTFCAPSNMRGSACRRAKAYPDRRACDVSLGKDRYSGKFVAGRAILIVGYGSECEAHVNDFRPMRQRRRLFIIEFWCRWTIPILTGWR